MADNEKGEPLARVSPEIRREQLLNCAVRAIRLHGARASMDQLAAEAGVTKPILYRHFGDRGGLVQALGERYVHAVMNRIVAAREGVGPDHTLRVTIDVFLEFLEGDPELYAFLMRATAQDLPRRSEVLELLGQLVTDVLAERFVKTGRSSRGTDLMANGIVGMLHYAGDFWINNDDYTRAEAVEYLSDFLLLGFAGLRERDIPPGIEY